MVQKKEILTISISTAVIAVFFILSALLFENYQPQIETVVGAKSLAGMMLYVFVFVLSVVFTPISSVPLIPVASRIWGVWATTALSVAGWTIGAMIAFYLARKFGRPHVARIISIKKIEKIEKLIPQKNIFLTIFFFRAVTPFDGLSYALGLITRVSPKTFFWSTFLGLIPFCLIMAYLGSLPAVFLILGLALAFLFLILGIYRIKRNGKKIINY
jgi:uncharacterized membrane protein YdjX (TVP38/TMEM64 family)